MRRLRVAAVAGVAVAVVVTVVSVLVPGIVEAFVPEALAPSPDARSEAAQAVLPVVGIAALVVAVVVAVRGEEASETDPLVSSPPERGTTTGFGVVGREFAQAHDHAADRRTDYLPPSRKERELVDRLREAAVETYAVETGASRSAAEHAVATGTWTDDSVAAWLLADDEVDPPFSEWLRERLLPQRTFRRQVQRTAAAIDDLRGDRP